MIIHEMINLSRNGSRSVVSLKTSRLNKTYY
nr:MAG TPA: hypothetical protein [Crassvirales sp.]